MKKLEKEDVLAIAKRKIFFVHKYLYSQQALRKLTRRMLKDQELILIRADYIGFHYRAASIQPPKEIV